MRHEAPLFLILYKQKNILIIFLYTSPKVSILYKQSLIEGAAMGGSCESLMMSWRFKNKICAHREDTDSCQGDSGR